MGNHLIWQSKQKHIMVPDHVVNKGAYINLMQQINKTARHNNQGSIETRDRYYQAVKRFVAYLADGYNLQKFKNVKAKHLASYIDNMQKRGLAASTIKADIAAIRFFHNQSPETRYALPTNEELKSVHQVELQRRSYGRTDRSWTDYEFEKMLDVAIEQGKYTIANMMKLARFQGLRLHEAVRIDRSMAENALKMDILIVKGKGGKVRAVPVREQTKLLFKDLNRTVKRGEKLFVRGGKNAKQVMESVQSFINANRGKCDRQLSKAEMTYHGLRHTYAKEEYLSRIQGGMSEFQARREVSQVLGHERDEVTRIYLADEGSDRNV